MSRSRRRRILRDAQTSVAAPAVAQTRSSTSSNRLLDLQRTVGNAAVQRLLQRKGGQASSDVVALATLTLGVSGEVEGDSREPGHEGKVEVLSAQLDTEAQRPGRGGGEELPRTTVHLTLRTGKATPVLMQAANKGYPVESAKFEFVKRDEEGGLSVGQTLEFENGYITGLSVSGDSEEHISLSIEFAK